MSNNTTLPFLERTISDHLYSIVTHMIEANEEVSIVVDNANDWDYELPQRLKSQKQFILDIAGDTLADAETDSDGFFTLTAEFDGEMYVKTFNHSDLVGIIKDKKPYLMKPFVEPHPTLTLTMKERPSEGSDELGLIHSMKMFERNNPDMFNKN